MIDVRAQVPTASAAPEAVHLAVPVRAAVADHAVRQADEARAGHRRSNPDREGAEEVDDPTGRSGWWARFVAHAVPVLPLFVVTGFAGYGQVLFGIAAYSPPDWPWPQRLGVAIGVAVGIESIGLYVQWHAHDALLMKATSTAARLRRASYLIAGAVAAINYSHFADPGWRPTPGAIVFAAFSAAGPWLWGLHTRRVQRVQLTREGQIDATGATFSAERWRSFPWRTWAARRWSIDHSIDDPRAAWEGYRQARAALPPRRTFTEVLGGWTVLARLVGVAGIEPAPAPPPAELPNRASTAEVPTAPHPEPPTVRASTDTPPADSLGAARGISTTSTPTTPDEPAVDEAEPDAARLTVGELVEVAAAWGADELRAGRTAGKRRLQSQFRGLSEHHAIRASQIAKDRATPVDA